MEKMWRGKWICDPRFSRLFPLNLFHKEKDTPAPVEHPDELKNQHMFVRRTFDYQEPVRNVFIDITADDYYKLYVNDHYVGQGPAPSYHFHYYYNRYDISRFLRQGRNVIAVDVYYQGLINRVWNSGDYRQGLIAELFADNQLYLATNTTWKYFVPSTNGSGLVTGYDTQYLEHINNSENPAHWKEPDFDDKGWSFVAENPSDDHYIFLQPTPPLQVYNLDPKIIKQIQPGEYLLDFGQEITGQFTARVHGQPGEKIILQYSEELESENTIKFPMRCNCAYEDSWVLSGEENEVIEFYDYKAFRYIYVSGPKDALNPKDFHAIVRHYPFDDTLCSFHSSDDLLNRIWTICKNGVKFGCQEVYVDCPSREKGQYLGDVLITAHSQIYLTGDLRLLKKAIEDYSHSAVICPGLMAVAPGNLMQEIADYSLQFSLLLKLYYQHSGNMEFLRTMLPVAQTMLAWFKRYQRRDGLLENVTDKWNLVDWPEGMRDNYDFNLSRPVGPGCHNVINAFYCGALKTIEELSEALSLPHANESAGIYNAFIKTFYNPHTGLFVDSTVSTHSSAHANILPLFFDLVPAQKKSSIVNFLKTKGMSCGVYMSYFLLKALARAGEYDYVYHLITDTGPHSWANMLREDATTCFEVWGKDQKWNTSLCHPWASAPVSVLVEDLIRLRPEVPGWCQIHFDPHLPASLDHLTLTIPTQAGKITVSGSQGQYHINL